MSHSLLYNTSVFTLICELLENRKSAANCNSVRDATEGVNRCQMCVYCTCLWMCAYGATQCVNTVHGLIKHSEAHGPVDNTHHMHKS